jgi:hypothetical protein
MSYFFAGVLDRVCQNSTAHSKAQPRVRVARGSAPAGPVLYCVHAWSVCAFLLVKLLMHAFTVHRHGRLAPHGSALQRWRPGMLQTDAKHALLCSMCVDDNTPQMKYISFSNLRTHTDMRATARPTRGAGLAEPWWQHARPAATLAPSRRTPLSRTWMKHKR